MQLVFLTLETACERLEGLRQGGELTKDSEHATLGSLVVQESEEPRETVSSGLAGSPAYMFWSSAFSSLHLTGRSQYSSWVCGPSRRFYTEGGPGRKS